MINQSPRILDEIVDKMYKFVVKHGREPKTLYLGKRESSEIDKFVSGLDREKTVYLGETKSKILWGLSIVFVENEFHIGFGLE